MNEEGAGERVMCKKKARLLSARAVVAHAEQTKWDRLRWVGWERFYAMHQGDSCSGVKPQTPWLLWQ